MERKVKAEELMGFKEATLLYADFCCNKKHAQYMEKKELHGNKWKTVSSLFLFLLTTKCLTFL